MSKLALVTPEGLIVSDNAPPSEVEKHQDDEPFHVKAAREAAKQSTPTRK